MAVATEDRVDAQEVAIDDARSELRAGRKRSHWMWFVFPQVEGLGSSPMAQRYAIGSLAEAGAYLKHPVLGEKAARMHRPGPRRRTADHRDLRLP